MTNERGAQNSTDVTLTRGILTDAFGRIAEQVEHVTGGLTEQASTFRPAPDANSIGWLIWHLSRVQDDHVSELAGLEQVWTAQGWAAKFALPFADGATGYGQSSDEVGQVRVQASLLAGYHQAVHRMTLDHLAELTPQLLTRVVDERWDPPVTAAVRLVSVINDCTDHVGQAEYILGLVPDSE